MYNSPQQWKINTWQAHSPLSWASCFYFSCCHFFLLLLLLFEYALLQDCRKQSNLPKTLQKAQHAGKYVTLTQSLTHTSEHSTQARYQPSFSAYVVLSRGHFISRKPFSLIFSLTQKVLNTISAFLLGSYGTAQVLWGSWEQGLDGMLMLPHKQNPASHFWAVFFYFSLKLNLLNVIHLRVALQKANTHVLTTRQLFVAYILGFCWKTVGFFKTVLNGLAE